MEYVTLGNTDMTVSRIAFGCEQLGGADWGRIDLNAVISAVRQAVNLGINFFDTADVYGLGLSEERLSKALGSTRRDVVIATKFGLNWVSMPNGGRAKTFYDSSPMRAQIAVEASLKRLRIDCIPLYQIHWPDPSTEIRKTMEALARFKEEGKIKHIGCSNFSADQLREAEAICPVISIQGSYNLIDRLVETHTFPVCHELGISFLAYGPLAQGLLSGKYSSDSAFDRNDRRTRLSHFQDKDLAKHRIVLQRIRRVASQYKRSNAQVAVRWVLDSPSVACAIVGIKTCRQLTDIIDASDWRMSMRDFELLSGLSNACQAANQSGCDCGS